MYYILYVCKFDNHLWVTYTVICFLFRHGGGSESVDTKFHHQHRLLYATYARHLHRSSFHQLSLHHLQCSDICEFGNFWQTKSFHCRLSQTMNLIFQAQSNVSIIQGFTTNAQGDLIGTAGNTNYPYANTPAYFVMHRWNNFGSFGEFQLQSVSLKWNGYVAITVISSFLS